MARKKIPGKRGYEYFLTQAGKELRPVIEQSGTWGMRWTRDQMSDSDYDVELRIMVDPETPSPSAGERGLRFRTDTREVANRAL